jgi:hypothetical protein
MKWKESSDRAVFFWACMRPVPDYNELHDSAFIGLVAGRASGLGGLIP